MLVKTEAIVLRVIPFSESSQVVTWLAATEGKIATMIKGVQRPKSAFLGQFDCFQTCELVYYSRPHADGLDIARECCPLATRPGLRSNWRSCAAASFACDLASRLSVHGDNMDRSYRLLADTLDFIDGHTARPALLFWFELRLLASLGLAPRLTSCVACRRPPTSGRTVAFSPTQSGVLCEHCRPHRQDRGTLELGPDLYALLRVWGDMPTPRRAQTTACSREQAFDLLRVFDSLLRFSLGTSVPSRALALETIATL